MDYQVMVTILEILEKYGLIVVFVLLFCEYLNLPGFPATPILMAIGAWARFEQVLLPAFLVSVAGGIAGTMFLYGVGRLFGNVIMDKYYKKFPKQAAKIDKYVDRIANEGPHVLTIARLIPVIRTLITIPAGMVKIDIRHFFWYSLLGIVIWNALFLIAGTSVYELLMQIQTSL